MNTTESLITRRAWHAARTLLALVCVTLLLSWNVFINVEASAGHLDSGFGSGGKVVTDFGRDELAWAVALQRDLKIVVAGTMDNKKKSNDFALARYNPDGSLDTTFGEGGGTLVDFFHGYDVAQAVAIQPDQKIVVAGDVSDEVHSYFGLARFNSDGSLDSSFGSDGRVTTEIFLSARAFSVGLQSDGKILAGGYAFSSTSGTDDDFAVVRYNPDGSLDESFGTGGKVITALSTYSDIIYAIAVQPDGKVVAAGYSQLNDKNQSRDFAVARYNADGSLDPSFGAGGIVTTDMLGGQDEPYAMALAPDGKIVVAGYSECDPTLNDFALVRYNTDGSLDPTFGSGGKVTTDFFGLLDAAFGVAIQANGRIVATGYAWPEWGNEYRDFALVRYEPDGSLDASFGEEGKAVTNFSGGEDCAFGVAITPNGRIITAGFASGNKGVDVALACYQGDAVAPLITGAEVIGKKLYVYGKSFDFDADVLLNDEKQKKTNNYEVDPSSVLITKKAGKKIAPGDTVRLQVRNPDGLSSNEFIYQRPLE